MTLTAKLQQYRKGQLEGLNAAVKIIQEHVRKAQAAAPDGVVSAELFDAFTDLLNALNARSEAIAKAEGR